MIDTLDRLEAATDADGPARPPNPSLHRELPMPGPPATRRKNAMNAERPTPTPGGESA